MDKDKDQASGRKGNAAIPDWENQTHDRGNTADGRKPQSGESTENAGMSPRGGLAKTE